MTSWRHSSWPSTVKSVCWSLTARPRSCVMTGESALPTQTTTSNTSCVPIYRRHKVSHVYYSGAFTNLKRGPGSIFQVYVFKSVQILAYFFTLIISTNFFTSKEAVGRRPLNTPLMFDVNNNKSWNTHKRLATAHSLMDQTRKFRELPIFSHH